jgi:hypothetical protein
MPARHPTWPLALLCCLPLCASGSEPAVLLVGDARLTWQADERTARDGDRTTADSLRLRARFGAESILGEQWRLRGRVAGLFSDDQEQTRAWTNAWTPTRTGLRDGDMAFDELFLRFLPANDKGSVRIGRFQTRFALNDLMNKSLDHRDSPAASVTWTNGVHWRYHLSDAWRWHSLARFNSSRGASVVARSPLVFDDSDSRVTWFTGLEGLGRLGPITERMIGLTYMPKTLASDGIDAPRREDYVTLTVRALAEWPLGGSGMSSRVGAEFGHAPNTPTRAATQTGSSGRAGGTAAQFSAGLYDFAPGHDVSISYGFAEAGWLISPSFRENDTLLELRYRWRMTDKLSVETRVRRREERALPTDAMRARVDEDFFVRLTLRL